MVGGEVRGCGRECKPMDVLEKISGGCNISQWWAEILVGVARNGG